MSLALVLSGNRCSREVKGQCLLCSSTGILAKSFLQVCRQSLGPGLPFEALMTIKEGPRPDEMVILEEQVLLTAWFTICIIQACRVMRCA